MPRDLTTKQRAFAVEYVRNGGNGTAAARVAGYAGNENTLHVAATKLVRVGTVAALVESLRGRALVKAESRGVMTLAEALTVASDIARDVEAERRDRLKGAAIVIQHWDLLDENKRPGVQINALVLAQAPPETRDWLRHNLAGALSGR